MLNNVYDDLDTRTKQLDTDWNNLSTLSDQSQHKQALAHELDSITALPTNNITVLELPQAIQEQSAPHDTNNDNNEYHSHDDSVHFSVGDDFSVFSSVNPEDDDKFQDIQDFVHDQTKTVQVYEVDEGVLQLDPSNGGLRRIDDDPINLPETQPPLQTQPESSIGRTDGRVLVPPDDDGANQPPRPHDSGSLEHVSTIYSQNTNGLWRRARDNDGNILYDKPRDTTKLENLIDRMRQDNIGAWFVQETWEEDDKFDVEIGGYHVFRHNCTPGESGRDHLFKGVCNIILSPEYYNAWKAAGSPPPITTDSKGQFAGRFISLTVKFQSYNSNGKRINGKFLKLALTYVYHPCCDPDHAQFCAVLSSLLKQIPNNTQILIGSDINARIGIKDNTGAITLTRSWGQTVLKEEMMGPRGDLARSCFGFCFERPPGPFLTCLELCRGLQDAVLIPTVGISTGCSVPTCLF